VAYLGIASYIADQRGQQNKDGDVLSNSSAHLVRVHLLIIESSHHQLQAVDRPYGSTAWYSFPDGVGALPLLIPSNPAY
jgi:hypothetical protein